MILIAHRGLFNGYDEEKENHPDQIKAALAAGFDAEIDVRLIDGKWFLGHDEPTHEVPEAFLSQKGLWIHCKNVEALNALASVPKAHGVNFFWHQSDDFTLTSLGYVWTFPNKPLLARSILNQPEWTKGWFDDPSIFNTDSYAGICSKFVGAIRSAL